VDILARARRSKITFIANIELLKRINNEVEIQKNVCDFIMTGNYLDAYNTIVNYYTTHIRLQARSRIQEAIFNDVGRNEVLPVGTTAKVYLTRRIFNYFYNDVTNWGNLVKSFYHEFVHIELTYGLYGREIPDDSNQEEILAHYETFTANLPSYTSRMAVYQIEMVNNYYEKYHKRSPQGALALLSYLTCINGLSPKPKK
jgi:hypothetical protein